MQWQVQYLSIYLIVGHFHFSQRPSKILASYIKDNWPLLSDDHQAISSVVPNIVPRNIRDALDNSSEKKGMRELL